MNNLWSKFKLFYAKNKIIAYPLMVGVAALVIIIFVIIPQLGGLLSTQDTINKSTERLKILEVKAEDLKEADEGSINKKLQTAIVALPEDKDFTTVISLMRILVAESSMELTSLQLGQLQGGISNLNGFSVKLEVKGPIQTFSNLLKTIENSSRVMRISGIEVSVVGGNTASATVSINIFYSPFPNDLGNIEVSLPKLNQEEENLLANIAKSQIASLSATPVFLPRGKVNPFE